MATKYTKTAQGRTTTKTVIPVKGHAKVETFYSDMGDGAVYQEPDGARAVGKRLLANGFKRVKS